MSEKPRVSVFIASYNHARYLPECLDSILAQTYQDFEIIVVDDGSDDGSHELLTSYQQRFPEKLFYFWHPGHANKGISATSNLAISKTRGEYLAWIGSDDIWDAEKLAQQVALLDSHPEYGMVYSYAQFIDAEGNEIGGLYGVDITDDPNPVGRMIQSCHPPAMTVVIRRDCLEQVGFFDETLIYSDWELFVRIFAHWKVGFITQPLARYRIHASNISKKIDPGLDLQRILGFTRSIREKSSSIQGTLTLPRNQALIELQLSFLFFCLQNEAQAALHLDTAFRTDPSLNLDEMFLNKWLNSWKPEFYTLSHPNFSFWFISRLPLSFDRTSRHELVKCQLANQDNQTFYMRRGVQLGLAEPTGDSLVKIFSDFPREIELSEFWKQKVLSRVYASLLFESFRAQDKLKARYYWLKSVQTDPSWLLNRGFWSIGLRSYLGFATASSS